MFDKEFKGITQPSSRIQRDQNKCFVILSYHEDTNFILQTWEMFFFNTLQALHDVYFPPGNLFSVISALD